MPDSIECAIHEWLRSHEAQLLEDTCAMLRIPSVESAPLSGAPFGAACREALDLALSMGERYGFATTDIEGMVGYAECGSGSAMVVSLGHLDVVPVGPGWKFDPFSATIDGGYIYARGATDDKGPTMAAFYAIRAIKECWPDLPVRLRAVFGCDEESGMTCVERYVQVEPQPTFGVAPDSAWPLIHGEKGICDLHFDVEVPESPFRLVEISGGQRLNIVIDACDAVVEVADGVKAEVQEKLDAAWDRNVEVRWASENLLAIRAVGKAAHGSTPWRGDSAATRIFRLLAEISPLETQEWYEALLWACHPSGVGLGIHGGDEPSKDLTCNLGVVSTAGNRVRLSFNVRYPVTWTGEQVRDRAVAFTKSSKAKFSLADFHDSPSLYFPLDHPLVETIVQAYRDETGDFDTEPGVMGGGTYARKIGNTVSIGTGWHGDGEAHQTNERLKVEHLFKMSRIYSTILYRLAKVAAGIA